jgi:hypothetical protein
MSTYITCDYIKDEIELMLACHRKPFTCEVRLAPHGWYIGVGGVVDVGFLKQLARRLHTYTAIQGEIRGWVKDGHTVVEIRQV